MPQRLFAMCGLHTDVRAPVQVFFRRASGANEAARRWPPRRGAVRVFGRVL